MTIRPILAMIRKDLRLFAGDRRALLMGFVAPVAIASFFGAVSPGAGSSREPAPIALRVADQDGGAVTRSIVAGLRGDRRLAVTPGDAEEARAAVRRGAVAAAVVIPAGFGDRAGRAFVTGLDRPDLQLLTDPSRGPEAAVVRGAVAEQVVRAVSQAVLGRPAAAPYGVRETTVTDGPGAAYNGYAHAFAGMGVQFVLFAVIDLGIGILLERQRGLWQRIRSAPVSRLVLLGGKAASGAVIALATLLGAFGFAMIVFGVRVTGSLVGFVAVIAACAVMAAGFGLLVAAVGRTPGAARGVAALAVLLMSMLGGAWVPTFVFPAWLQRLGVLVPVRWAVDGLDAMTWRGLGASSAVAPTFALLAFAAAFVLLALARFRWDDC